MKHLIFAFLFCQVVCAAPIPKELKNQPHDWAKALEYSKEKGKSVSVIAYDVEEVKGGCEVLLVDDDKEYSLGWAAFFPVGIKTCSFSFDLKSVLVKFDKPPSNKSVVVIKDRAGNVVKYDRFELRFYELRSKKED